MFWKRQVPIAIVFITGILTLYGWFVDSPTFEGFVNDDATQWFDIIASFAIILGALNLLKLQMTKIIRQKKDWQYSILAVLGFFFAITAGFFWKGANYVHIQDVTANMELVAPVVAEMEQLTVEQVTPMLEISDTYDVRHIFISAKGAESYAKRLKEAGVRVELREKSWGEHLLAEGTVFNWLFKYLFTPMSATMFALLAFFVASASYRAFRIRNFEATLLLLSGIIIMLGRVPIGSNISAWFVAYLIVLAAGVGANIVWKNMMTTFAVVGAGILIVTVAGAMAGWPVDKPGFLFLPVLQEWIYTVPNIAGARAIMIGIALGMIGTSLRIILGIEKSFMGE